MEVTSTIISGLSDLRRPIGAREHCSGDPLRIWHIGASASPHSVNGVNIAIWRIAAAQAAAGHDIHLPVLTDSIEARDLAAGVTRHIVPMGPIGFGWRELRRLLATQQPDIVHLHSAFVPRHTMLGRFLRSQDTPYVVTPHGGLLPQVLHRDRAKKLVYSVFLERPYVRGACGVTAVTPEELEHVRTFAAPDTVRGCCILNPISSDLEAIRWSVRSVRPSILFLGRFDVVTKGLDRLIEIARRMPEADFHLYGRSHSRRDDAVLRSAPTNVSLHDPVYGPEKLDVFSNASLYLQPSRWEAFSISVAEALAAGVPCALTENLNQAEILAAEGAAFRIPEDPARAAGRLQQLLADSNALLKLSARGRRFARERLAADGVARSYVEFYRELLGRSDPKNVLQQPRTVNAGVP